MSSFSCLHLIEQLIMKKDRPSYSAADAERLEKRRKYTELAASLGLIIVFLAMIAPFFGSGLGNPVEWGRWVYAAGALVYTVARVIDVNAPGDSLRLRRLRRLEFWAGMCFIVGGAFWFYKLSYYSGIPVGSLAVMQQTVAFTMAGAVIQIVASWMISSQMKKENKR